ncbi:MAG: mechanosensitive ion channel family protein [Desulfobacteraceae bacterium]|jgi:small-conductance mechanosensitive channel
MEKLLSFLNRISSIAQSNTLPAMAIKTAGAIILALIAWIVIKTILRLVRKRLTTYEWFSENQKLFDMARKATGLAMILFVGAYLIQLFHLQMIEKLWLALFVILLASPINGFLLVILKYFEEKWVKKSETKVDNIIFDLLNRFSGAIIYAIAVILALDTMGINVMPFVAGAGVMGIAIGFAAKDTLSNLIAGILLIIDRPFEIGDRIEVWSAPAGSASWGDVIDIGLRATKIKTTDNIIIVIPNNEIMKRDIVNYTLISTSIRVRINIGVAYNTDIERAKKLMIQVAKAVKWVQDDPMPKVVVRNFGESSVDLQLRAWINDARQRMNTISTITDRIKSAFDEANIEIPYPKRDIQITHTGTSSPDSPVNGISN